jgi:NADH-ubiquinone oxidoreductase chain 1
MERKIISINQFRLGPNKIILGGIVQPIFDGFKLFLKIINRPQKNNLFFYISPCISFFLRIVFWSLFFSNSNYFKNLFFIFILGIRVYSFVLAGWSRFSKFGYLGGIRASSQTVSYEIRLRILLISIIFFSINFSVSLLKINNFYFIIFPLILNWIISLISETNRAPFDFSEGERELISGFNIEYGSSGFVLYFLSEYAIIIFFSLFTCFLFNFNLFTFFLLLFLFISLRTSFPRFRYDFLLKFIWFKILPFICLFFIFLILI